MCLWLPVCAIDFDDGVGLCDGSGCWRDNFINKDFTASLLQALWGGAVKVGLRKRPGTLLQPGRCIVG